MSMVAKRGRVLVVAQRMCKGDTASGDLRLQRLLEMLADFGIVDFLVAEMEPPHSDPAHRYWRLLRDAGVDIVDSRFYERVSLWCQSRRLPYDWIVAEFWEQAERIAADVEELRGTIPGLRFAIDTVDVHYLRERAALDQGSLAYGSRDTIEARKRRELMTYGEADLLMVCSEEDAQALARDVRDCTIAVIPNVVASRSRTPDQRAHALVFIGGFCHQPNVDAIRWFALEVFPLIRARVPDAELFVLGSNAPAEVEELGSPSGVHVIGYVPETAPWLDRAAVSVAPLRYGAGMKGKVTEALSAGVPVVTTSIGAQGLGATSAVHLHVADSATEFADAVVRCLADPSAAEMLGRKGQELVESVCGPERIRRDLEAVLAPMAPGSRPADRPTAQWRLAWARLRCRLWLLRFRLSRLKQAITANLLAR